MGWDWGGGQVSGEGEIRQTKLGSNEGGSNMDSVMHLYETVSCQAIN